MNYLKIYPSDNPFFPDMFFHEMQLFFNHYLHSYLKFLSPTGAVNNYFTFILFKNRCYIPVK